MNGNWKNLLRAIGFSFRTWQSSTLVAIVVIPVALDQAIAGLDPSNASSQRDYAWTVFGIVTVLGLCVFIWLSLADYKRRITQVRASENVGLQRLPEALLQEARALVIQQDKPRSGRWSAPNLADFLVGQFPNIDEVVMVKSLEQPEEDAVEIEPPFDLGSQAQPRFEKYRSVISVPALDVMTEAQRAVVVAQLREVAGRHHGHVVVDITRGTKGMSLNMAEVARSVGIPVIYTPLDSSKKKYSDIYLFSDASAFARPEDVHSG